MISPDNLRYRRLSFAELRSPATTGNQGRRFMPSSIYSDSGGETTRYTYTFEGAPYQPLLGYFFGTYAYREFRPCGRNP